MVMVAAFAHALRSSLAMLNVTPEVVNAIESNVAKLGDLQAPAGVDPPTATVIRAAVMQAFVFGFRMVMVLCAFLAVISAAVAWRKIPAR
jgi:hypothetical protein